jgi:general secretion pathway protein D
MITLKRILSRGLLLITVIVLLCSQLAANEQSTVSLDVKGLKVEEVVRLLATSSGANIVIADGVEGRVTLSVNDMPLEDVLDLIVKSLPTLTWEKKETPYIIYELKPAGDIEFYRLKYARMEDVGTFLGFFVPSAAASLYGYSAFTTGVTSYGGLRGTTGTTSASSGIGLFGVTTATGGTTGTTTGTTAGTTTGTNPFMAGGVAAGGAAGGTSGAALATILDQIQIRAYPPLNSVIIMGKPEKRAQVRKILEAIDVAPPEVLIEAQFVDMQAGIANNFNVSWQLGSGKLGVDLHTPMVSEVDGKTSTEYNTGAGIQYGTVMPNVFTAALNALVSENKAKILTSPKIAAINNQAARILLAEDYNYKINRVREEPVTSGNSTSYRTITETVWETAQVGIALTVIPQVHPNGMVTTMIMPEVSTLTGQATIDAPPNMARRTALTTIRVRDGETIVIGGLAQKTQNDAEYKIPLLGDLPLVGNLFKNKNKNDRASELVIFLTPRILPY